MLTRFYLAETIKLDFVREFTNINHDVITYKSRNNNVTSPFSKRKKNSYTYVMNFGPQIMWHRGVNLLLLKRKND